MTSGEKGLYKFSCSLNDNFKTEMKTPISNILSELDQEGVADG